jgi:hypothetical protein
MWSGNHQSYIQLSRLLRLQSFRITLYLSIERNNYEKVDKISEDNVSSFYCRMFEGNGFSNNLPRM